MVESKGETHLSEVADEGAARPRGTKVDTVAGSSRADLCRHTESAQWAKQERRTERTDLARADVGVLVTEAVAEGVVVVANDLAATSVAVAGDAACEEVRRQQSGVLASALAPVSACARREAGGWARLLDSPFLGTSSARAYLTQIGAVEEVAGSASLRTLGARALLSLVDTLETGRR
jgi:hypothetical protein